MTTEDNYTMPNRTIAEYLELGYTISDAKSLVSRAEAEQADRLRRNALATIEELNQYLLGNPIPRQTLLFIIRK